MASVRSMVREAVDAYRRHEPAYALGRFHAVRRAYGIGRGLAERVAPRRSPAPASPAARLVAPFDEARAVEALRRDAFYGPLQLSTDVVDAIRRFAAEGTYRRQARPPDFHLSGVREGRLPNGEIAVLADVLGVDRNEAALSVAYEPSVMALVARYLGFTPSRPYVRLMRSFVCEATDSVRLQEGQTVDYHFDVHGYNFAYANYYLTDCDAGSGAHTMIVGSHVDKPLSWLLGTARKSDAEIRAHYAAEREIVLEGPAGFGFVQDSSCFHRALAPRKRERLMLQVRYF